MDNDSVLVMQSLMNRPNELRWLLTEAVGVSTGDGLRFGGRN